MARLIEFCAPRKGDISTRAARQSFRFFGFFIFAAPDGKAARRAIGL